MNTTALPRDGTRGDRFAGTHLRVPLAESASVGHWRLGRVHEQRFDVPDQPMQGKMDPFFFLTKVKNFIPHEYPCRREFAALYRDKPPTPSIDPEPVVWWFPFGSPRVDLSGFWFRPTHVECWAETAIEANAAQTARFRFATCGGAILRVNGEDNVTLSRYQRNLEETIEVDVPLLAGMNLVEVWFSDLCERDARYYFELALISGRGLRVAVPVPINADRTAEIEELLAGMHFERPFYGAGDVVLLFPRPASTDLSLNMSVSGDFMSTEIVTKQFRLKHGESRLVLGNVHTLPADFRHFTIAISLDSFSLSRTLALEICHLAELAEPPPSIEGRAEEALAYVAERGEPDTVRALARLATGKCGAETDAMIAAGLPAIVDCHDCADFILVPLLWCRTAYADQIGAETRQAIDDAILRFRYWMDEPGNDVMWYFSENHALLFHTACYLAGSLFPEAVFERSGRKGREQKEVGRRRLIEWLDHFENFEMAEWNSAPYFPIDFKGLATLFALAPDPDIKDRAKRAILRLLEIVALSSHQGLLTASQGRSYEHSLRPGRTLELSAIARLFFGHGWHGRRFHALPQLALAVRDHDLRTDPRLAEFAFWDHADAIEWSFRQGQDGTAALYHHKTRDHAMGSIAAYRTGEWGYQETVLHLRLAERPEAQSWINHPGERILSGYARPSYWGGCGALPRVHQYRDLAVLDFELKLEHVDFTHAWLPEMEMDEVRHDGNRVLIRAGRAYALLIGSTTFQRVTDGPTANCEIRLPGIRSRWIVRLSEVGSYPTLEAFAARFAALCASAGDAGAIVLRDPDYGRVTCMPDGKVTAEGRTLDPLTWTRSGRLLRLQGGGRLPLPSQDQGQCLDDDQS